MEILLFDWRQDGVDRRYKDKVHLLMIPEKVLLFCTDTTPGPLQVQDEAPKAATGPN